MPGGNTEAQALLGGDRIAAAKLGEKLLIPANDNFVERPWGSFAMHEFKRSQSATKTRIGEAFELAADDRDAEARRYSSTVHLADGSTVSLPKLLEVHAETLLGAAFVAAHGPRWPLHRLSRIVGDAAIESTKASCHVSVIRLPERIG